MGSIANTPSLLWAAALLTASACHAQAPQEASAPPLFRDVTATHLPRARELHALDIALADFDHDGDLDAALAVEGAPNRLYVNDGRGRFAWREGAFGQRAHDTEHVRAADFDRDGHMDLVFVAEDDRVHQLFLGRGDGSFVDASARLPAMSVGNGLAVGDVNRVDETARRLPANRFSSWGGAVTDFNRDGRPDIVLGAIAVPGFEPLQVRSYANDGQGRFHDATAATVPETVVGRSWSMAVGDVDKDGTDDLFIGGWGTQARLLLGSSPSP